MEAARGALAGAVAALCDGPRASPRDASDGSGCASCGRAEVVPDAWKALEKWPVLTRFAIAQWTQTPSASVTTPLKRPGRKKEKELRVRSAVALCVCLHRCGVLACSGSDDAEVVEQLLDAVTMPVNLLGEVLQQRSLAWIVRCRLLQYALAKRRESIEAALELVCVALQDELRSASVERVVSGAPSAKRSKKRGRESISRVATPSAFVACDACQHRRPTDSGRACLVRALDTWTRVQEPTESIMSTIQAVKDLIDVLKAPDIRSLLQPSPVTESRHDGRRRHQGRGSASAVPVRWDDCDRIVDALCSRSEHPVQSEGDASVEPNVKPESRVPPQDSPTMWRLIWRRQRARMGSITTYGSLGELVLLCAAADQVSSLSSGQDVKAETVGVEVLLRTAEEMADSDVHVVRLLLRGIAAAVEGDSASSRAARRPLMVNPARFVDYVGLTLRRNRIEGNDSESTRDAKATPMLASTPELVECIRLVHDIIGARDVQSSRRYDLSSLWFLLLCRLTMTSSASTSWTTFLDAVAQSLVALKGCTQPPRVVGAFEAFVCDIIISVILSNGTRIGCCGRDSAHALEVDIDEVSQSTLRALLPAVCTELAESAVGDLVYRLCVFGEHKSQSTGAPTDLTPFPEGLKRLFLPCLVVFLDSAVDRDTAMSGLISAAHARIRTRAVDRLSLSRILALLLCEWQSYTQRNVSMKSGLGQAFLHEAAHATTISVRLFVDLGVWQDLVRLYASNPSQLRYEPRDFLEFLRIALQRVDPSLCPRDLEGSLFSVLSDIASLTSSPTATVNSGSESLSILEYSDDTIHRFLRVFETCTSRHASQKMIQDLEKEGKAEDLVLCLRRWLGISCSVHGAMSIDIRHGLIVLASRLVYSEESSAFDSLRMMMSPVDTVVGNALGVYIGTTQNSPAGLSAPVSIVRLNLMIRAYVGLSSGFPNLAALTSMLVDACLACADIEVRDSLIKLLVGFSKYLIVEVVVDKLHRVLLSWRYNYQVRNAFALILQARNSLRVTLSQETFSVSIAEQWLPLLIDLSSGDQTSPRVVKDDPVENLLECVESLLRISAESQQNDILSGAYPLAALFATAEVAQVLVSGVSQPSTRVQGISVRLHEKLRSINSSTRTNIPVESSKLIRATSEHQDGKREFTDPRNASSNSVSRVAFVSIYPGDAAVPVSDVHYVSLSWPMPGPRFFIPFVSWINGTIRSPTSNEFFEAAFIEMVLQFYLPVEFDGDSTALLTEWLSTWITISVQVGACITLRDFQKTLLRQLVGSSAPNASWHVLVHSARILIQDPSDVKSDIMAGVVNVIDAITLASVHHSHPNVNEVLCGMAADISMLLCQNLPSQLEGRACFAFSIVSPLVEVFVRVSLIASSTTSYPATPLERVVNNVTHLVAVIRNRLSIVGGQDNDEVSVCTLWGSFVTRWMRQYSYLSPRNAPRVFTALTLQQL